MKCLSKKKLLKLYIRIGCIAVIHWSVCTRVSSRHTDKHHLRVTLEMTLNQV